MNAEKVQAFCTLYDIDPEKLHDADVAGIEKAISEMDMDAQEGAIRKAIAAVDATDDEAEDGGQQAGPLRKGLFDKALSIFRKTVSDGLFGKGTDGDEEDEEEDIEAMLDEEVNMEDDGVEPDGYEPDDYQEEGVEDDNVDIDFDIEVDDDEADEDELDEDEEPLVARRRKVRKSVGAHSLQVVDGEQLVVALGEAMVDTLEPLYKAVQALMAGQENVRKGLGATPRSTSPYSLLDKRFDSDGNDKALPNRAEVIEVTQTAVEKSLDNLTVVEATMMQAAASDAEQWPHYEARFDKLKKAVGQ